jgi:uncharacterized protein
MQRCNYFFYNVVGHHQYPNHQISNAKHQTALRDLAFGEGRVMENDLRRNVMLDEHLVIPAHETVHVDAWILTLDKVFLFIPWPKLMLIELTANGAEAIRAFQTTGAVSPTIERLLKLCIESFGTVPVAKTPIHDSTPPTLTIGLTSDCALRCIYCYADSGMGPPSEPLIDATYRAIDLTVSQARSRADKRCVVHFQGSGEPTAKFEKFKKATNYVKRQAEMSGIKLALSITTNGYYGTKVSDFLIENFDSISLSLDGMAGVQNAQRPTCHGKSSFDRVFETAKTLFAAHKRSQINLGIRATVSRASLKLIEEIHAFFTNNFPGIPVKYEPLFKFGRADALADAAIPDYDEFLCGMISLNDKFEYDLSEYSATSSIFEPREVFCASLSIPTLNVNHKGDLTACQGYGYEDDYYVFGKYSQDSCDFLLDDEKVRMLRSTSVHAYKECSSCIAKYYCAGDCPYLRRKSVTRCRVNLAIAKQQISNFRNDRRISNV